MGILEKIAEIEAEVKRTQKNKGKTGCNPCPNKGCRIQQLSIIISTQHLIQNVTVENINNIFLF